MISHAIFCLFPSHPTPHRIVFHSASHPTLASRPALRSTSHPALRPASRLSSTSHPALHSSPYSAQPCSHPASHHALHPAHRPPPFPSSSLSQVSSSSRPPISDPRLSTLRVPQPSPFTPHPIMPCALTPIPHHPFPSHFFAPQDSFSQVPPSTSLHLPPVHQSPIRVSPPSVFLSQAPSPRISPRIPSCPSPCAPTPFPTTHFPSASLHPPCSSAKSRLWIFSCVKRPGSLTT